MKNIFSLVAISVLLIGACKKKDNEPKSTLLSKIRYYNNPNTFDVTYQLHYISDSILERISLKGFNSAGSVNTHYFMKYDLSGKLDSIIQFDSISNTRWDAVGADWTGNNMTFFWRSTYTFDSQGRIVTSTSIAGNILRYSYLTDSTVVYFDPVGSDPEYKSYVTYRASNVKNPFRLRKNETLYPINNYVFNFINHTCREGMFELAESKNSNYSSAGTLQSLQYRSYEGNVNGYPTKLNISYEGAAETRMLEFSYK